MQINMKVMFNYKYILKKYLILILLSILCFVYIYNLKYKQLDSSNTFVTFKNEPQSQFIQNNKPNNKPKVKDETSRSIVKKESDNNDDDKDEPHFSLSEFLTGIPQDDPRILNEIRNNFLFPPSDRSIPYNFNNKKFNKVNGPVFSFNNTSQLIIEILDFKKNGIFVECGSNDGEDSNTLLMERDYNWTGVLMECQPASLDKLFLKRRKAWISNLCASPVGMPMEMIFNQIMDYDVASHLMINRDVKNVKDLSDIITVQCFPIYSILAALNYKNVDYLSLDVESVEFDVLKTIPWDKIIFKVITVEVQFIKDMTIALKKYMNEKGYIFVSTAHVDYVFVHNSTFETSPFIQSKYKEDPLNYLLKL